MNLRTYARLCFGLILLPVLAGAQPVTQPTTQPIRVVLHPSALGRPAMKYRLLPDSIDLTEGNAATLYLMACSRSLLSAAEHPLYKKDVEDFEDWLHSPPGELDRPRVRHLLNGFQHALRQVELGARREHCHWDLPTRTEGFNTLLPHLSELRLLTRLLCLQARLEIADGKFEEAAHTLQTGFAMARHLNEDAFLVQSLVGIAMGSALAEQVQFWIVTPGSPNLYWPLTDLPAPFMDLRRSVRQGERSNFYHSIPHLKEAAAGKLTSEHLAEILSKLEEIRKVSGDPATPPLEGSMEAWMSNLSQVGLALPQAKKGLLDLGYAPSALDAMKPSEVVGLWWITSYNEIEQDMTKSMGLPLFQDLALETADTESLRLNHSSNPFLMMLPVFNRAKLSGARLDRRIGELRSLEVIRAYAAKHDGAAPPSLTGIAETPVPIDPVTGSPFPYRLADGVMILETPVPPGGSPKDGRRDEIRMVK